MRPTRLLERACILVAVCSLVHGLNLPAEERLLTVKLVSGREFTAYVDERTEELLWLR